MAAIGKYNPTTVKIIIEVIDKGGTDRDACQMAGINPDTFYRWVREKSEFSDAVNTARLGGKLAALGAVRSAFEKDWKAAAWYLERKYAEEFARTEKPWSEAKREASEEVERLAKELGLSESDAMAALEEAERVMGGKR